MKNALILAFVIALTGCATGEYQAYADIHKANAKAQEARYKALSDIATSGDTTAKVAAVMTLTLSGGQQQAGIAAPKSLSDHLLQWTSVVLPAATQIYGIGKNVDLGIAQSNNAREVSVSTNQAFVGIASQIQAPASNVTNTYTDNSVRTDSTHTPTVVTQPAPVVQSTP